MPYLNRENVVDMIAELKQCQLELKEAANILSIYLPGVSSIYSEAAGRVQSKLDAMVVDQKID